MIQKFSIFFQKLSDWFNSGDGISSLYEWIVFALCGTALVSLTFFVFKSLFRLLIYKFFKAKKYTEFLGEYYLYHPPLIPGLNSLPRVSKFTLRSNWITPGKAKQSSINPRKTIYSGNFKVQKTVLFASLYGDDCPKAVVLWHFQKRSATNDRIAFGTMCCINYQEEPYRAPIIVAESRIPIANVLSAFQLMNATTITREIRRKLMIELNHCEVGDPNEEFEHIIIGTAPIGNYVSRKNRLRQWIGNKF